MARRVVVLCLIVLAALCAAAPAARAHAIVQHTIPGIDAVVERSPEQVVMHFNEPVEIAFGAIRVFDSTAERVDTGEVDYVEDDPTGVEVGLEPNLPDGTYTVTWRVISADSHVISEAFVFHVGEPGAKPQGIAAEVLAGQDQAGATVGAAFAVVRVIGFASLLVLVGAVIFLLYVWQVAAPEESPPRFHRLWRRLLVSGWAGLLVASCLSLPLQAAQAGGTTLAGGLAADALSSVLSTRFGQVMALRALLLLVAAGLWVWLRPRAERKDTAFEVVADAICLGLLVCTALAGHAGSTPPVAINVPVDVLHLLSVAAWVGGLSVLVAAAFPSFGDSTTGLARVVSRYSDVAVVAVAVVVITGTWQTFVEVKALSAFDTPYGWTLLTKIALFLPLVGLGAINNRWAKPRIEKAGDPVEQQKGLSTLKRLVAIEVVLAVAVVSVTAFLVNLPPARVAAGIDGPFITDVALGEDELNVLVDPNKVGENEVHLTVTTPEGAPVDVREMRVLFTMPAESIGPIVGQGTKLAKGHFVVQGHQLSVGGRWTLEVVARISRFEEVRTRVPVTANG